MRQARIRSEYQHIIVRGIGRQILFEDDTDRKYYISLLKRFREDTGVSISAYCLMENHVHLLVRDKDDVMPVFMKKLGVTYALYFNRKYDRTGHLFQDRYKSEVIGDDAYYLTVYRYILNNPEKAGISKAKEYTWSSYAEYGTSEGITDTGLLQSLIGGKDDLDAFLGVPEESEVMEYETVKHDDNWAREQIHRELNLHSGTEIQSMPRAERDEKLSLLKRKGLSIRQIERLTGINRGVIQKA